MEDQYQHTVNGQEVIQDDLNLLGETSALADDRLLAELVRLAPNSIDRAIIPFGYHAGITALKPTVAPSGSADGSVRVWPFRAIVGTRTAIGTDQKKHWRDIRSAFWYGESSQLYKVVTLSANASGNARWDLVYAAVTIDAEVESVSRKVKATSGTSFSTQSVYQRKRTSVAIGVVTGTASATPAAPTLPADGAGVYYIKLAYVRVPNGFGSGSTVAVTDIHSVAPIYGLSRVNGASFCRPSTSQNEIGGGALSTARAAAWANSGTRPLYVMPADMVGSEELMVAVNCPDATPANWSHADQAIVDNSVDWRKRMFTWTAMATDDAEFPWESSISSTDLVGGAFGDPVAHGMGQSFFEDMSDTETVSGGGACRITAADFPVLVQDFFLYVDLSTGALKVHLPTGFIGNVFVWLKASGQFSNA